MKKLIIKLFYFFLVLLCSYNISAQNDSLRSEKSNKSDRKFIVWVSPSEATHVYGFMFNLWNKDHGPFPKIYGVEFNISPVGIFAPFLIGLYSLNISNTFNKVDELTCPLNYDSFKKVNGIQLGFINLEPTVINGIDINASKSSESVTNGVTVSMVSNEHYEINGLTIAIIANTDYRCRGSQIALLNNCNDLKGFQFGLWNKNQKRSLPFINWAFKS